MDRLYLWFFRKIANMAIKIESKAIRKMVKSPKEQRKKYEQIAKKAEITEQWASDWVAYYIGKIYGEQTYGCTNKLYEDAVKRKDLRSILRYTQPISLKLLIRTLVK